MPGERVMVESNGLPVAATRRFWEECLSKFPAVLGDQTPLTSKAPMLSLAF